jgi:hypothetical protein
MPRDVDDLQRGIVNFVWGIVNLRWGTYNFGKGSDNLDRGTKNFGEGSPESEGAGLDVHSGRSLALGSNRRAEEARNCPGYCGTVLPMSPEASRASRKDMGGGQSDDGVTGRGVIEDRCAARASLNSSRSS